MIATILGVLLATLAVVGTIIPLFRFDNWWIRVFDFPRIHMLVMALAALGLIALAMGPSPGWPALVGMALVAAAAVVQIVQIAPYTVLWKKQVLYARAGEESDRLRILVANVLMSNRKTERLVELVRRYEPDLLLAVETDAYWAEALGSLEDLLPYVVSRPLENTYGMILRSRLELEDPEVKYLIADDIPSVHAHVTLPGGTRVRLYFLHPRPPYPKEDDDTTERDAELLVVGRQVAAHEEIAVVAGDLNDVAWSHTTRLFQRISSMLDPRVGRGMYNTFHAGMPLLRWPLDHVFFTEHFKLVRLERLPKFGSDHFPIFVELAVVHSAPAEHEEPEADEDDHREAAEQIEKARTEQD